MDWFKGKFTGNPRISWENPGFPVEFPLNQSIDDRKVMNELTHGNHVTCITEMSFYDICPISFKRKHATNTEVSESVINCIHKTVDDEHGNNGLNPIKL